VRKREREYDDRNSSAEEETHGFAESLVGNRAVDVCC